MTFDGESTSTIGLGRYSDLGGVSEATFRINKTMDFIGSGDSVIFESVRHSTHMLPKRYDNGSLDSGTSGSEKLPLPRR